jgi:hypothetical protein
MSSHFGLTYLLEHFIALGAGRQTRGLRARFLGECRKPVLERYSLNEVTPQHIDDLPDVVRRAIAVRGESWGFGGCRVASPPVSAKVIPGGRR